MATHFGGFNSSCKTDSFGFKKPDAFDEKSYEDYLSNYLPVLARRSKRWDDVLPPSAASNGQNRSIVNGSDNVQLPRGVMADRKLKRFIRKGIPASLRPKVWFAACGAQEALVRHPDEYEKLRRISISSTEASGAIELDLNRTFPDNEYFQNIPGNIKNQLADILHAFAVKHPDIGYCQGLNYVAGMLLLVMKSPEKAFWVLECSMDDPLLNYYTRNMQGLHTDVSVFKELLIRKAPEVNAIFEKFDVDLLLLTSKWFLCWFLETLPIETVLRIWDCFFYEGQKILFRVALTLILKNKDRFLQCTNLMGVLDLFKIICTDPLAVNCHQFMKDVFTLPGHLSRHTIDSLREKFESGTKK